MQSDITFDNIYIGHSVDDASKLAKETYEVKRPVEEAEDENREAELDRQTHPFAAGRLGPEFRPRIPEPVQEWLLSLHSPAR